MQARQTALRPCSQPAGSLTGQQARPNRAAQQGARFNHIAPHAVKGGRAAAAYPEVLKNDSRKLLEQQLERQQEGQQGLPPPQRRRRGRRPSPPPDEEEPEEAADLPTQPPSLLPKLALLVSAMLWGSYAVSVRLLFSSPDPPDVSVIMAARGVMQAAVLVAVTSAMRQPAQQGPDASSSSSIKSSSGSSSSSSDGTGSDADAGAAGSGGILEQWLTLRSPPLWMAALELGLWNYGGTSLQTIGLQLTGATRASFLIQATLMLTPLLSTLAGYRPARRVWAGCGLALAGTLLITADEAGDGAGQGLPWDGDGLALGGDAAILAAALFYSLAVVRISGYAQTLPPAQIATSKSLVLCGLAVAGLAVAAAGAVANGQPVSSLLGGVASDPPAWAALAWGGVGPGALAAYLHVQGQKHVAPAEAQVIFSSKPLWAAGMAWLLLGGEELGPLTWVGGSALVAAGLVASTAPPGKQVQGQR